MDNQSIKQHYDESNLNWHSGFNESLEIIKITNWQGKKVLEIGCGEGHLASMIKYAGGDYTGIDYSKEQIERARKNYPGITFASGDYHKQKGVYDVVVMQGVLEHLDNPNQEFKYITSNLLSPLKGSQFVVSCPHWINPRGYILQALRILLESKISLTDLHYFLPRDMSRFGAENNLVITDYVVTDESWGRGQECLDDLKERLPKCCPDIPNQNINDLIEWLDNALLKSNIKLDLQGATQIIRYERQ